MRDRILNAIESQLWLRISFQREKDEEYITREVAPYDIFSQETGKNEGEERLIGYTKAHEDYRPGVISLYLKNICTVIETGEKFDGPQIRSLIDPARTTVIHRGW